MRSADRLKAAFGANMAESMASPPPSAADMVPVARTGPSRYEGTSRLKGALAIPLGLIDPDPDQPRKEFDPEALALLADSLRERGQLMPCRVRWDEGRGRWTVVAGERRWRAAKLAGLAELLAVEAQSPLGPAERLDEQLIENCVREDLKPVEKARAFKALMDRGGLTASQVADRLRVAKATVSRALALLDLPGETQAAVDAGEIAAGTAYEIGLVPDAAEQGRLTELARAGRVKRSQVRDAARPRPACTRYRTRYGEVSVAADEPDRVEKALAEALRLCRLEKKGSAA